MTNTIHQERHKLASQTSRADDNQVCDRLTTQPQNE